VHPADRDARTLRVDIPAGIDELAGEEATFAVLEIQDIAQIDPLFARARFSLATARRTDRDPALPADLAGMAASAPGISYLAKDFQSFRQSMLDRMAVSVPDWRESHPADIGNVVIDVLAYAADYLSYYQDAVATEAYLDTARRRTSVRRHARLLDYRMHEGCSARVWLRIEVKEDCTIARGLRTVCDEPGQLPEDSFAIAGKVRPPRDGRAVFETVERAALFLAHNELQLYAWGASEFRLRAGATSAALYGRLGKLVQGDVLIFASETDAASARPRRYHPVRLNRRPRLTADPLTGEEITEIAWTQADALPFDLVVATRSGDAEAVAWGNIVAADAGFTVGETELPQMQDDGRGRMSVRLDYPDLVHAVPYDGAIERTRPAASFTQIDPADATPAIVLRETAGASPDDDWTPRPDLLDSDRFARDFVVESDGDGTVALRFGDDVYGMRPPAGTGLRAVHRTGRGDRNVGAMSIRSWDRRPGEEAIASVCNPLPAAGGVASQPVREVRRDAPEAFRNLRQCVTAQDYVTFIKTDPRVRDAVAQSRWTGSRHTVFVHVQPAHGGDLDPDLRAELAARLEARRILGGDFALRSPLHVPLRIALTVSVERSRAAGAVRRDVVAAVEDLYRADRMRFGAPVFLSPLIARAAEVPGVADVTVDTFRRFGRPPLGELAAGRIDLGPTEVARLDNRPDAPDRGRLIVRAVSADAKESA
jgi:hypothetical protein